MNSKFVSWQGTKILNTNATMLINALSEQNLSKKFTDFRNKVTIYKAIFQIEKNDKRNSIYTLIL